MAETNNITGVILAAGQGSRMHPFSERRPKPLLPILNRPLLAHQLDQMAQIGIKQVIIVIGYSFLLGSLFDLFLGSSLTARLGLAATLLIPLGFALGLPFPLGVRLLKGMNLERHIAWAWGLNGVSSVLGSALTIAAAIEWGFSQALLIGAGCYALVFLLFLAKGPGRIGSP